MPRDLLLYLEDILDAVASIRSYVGDRTFDEFVGDRMCLLLCAARWEAVFTILAPRYGSTSLQLV
jgi:uncharacterized protein with HEPN domain